MKVTSDKFCQRMSGKLVWVKYSFGYFTQVSLWRIHVYSTFPDQQNTLWFDGYFLVFCCCFCLSTCFALCSHYMVLKRWESIGLCKIFQIMLDLWGRFELQEFFVIKIKLFSYIFILPRIYLRKHFVF